MTTLDYCGAHQVREAGSTLVASRSCTHGPRFSLLIRFLVSIKFEHLPYFNFYQHGHSIDRCIISILPTDIALWRYNNSQCSLHSTYVSRTRSIYSVIVWTRPFGGPATCTQQLLFSKKKILSSKGGFRGNRETPLDPPLCTGSSIMRSGLHTVNELLTVLNLRAQNQCRI